MSGPRATVKCVVWDLDNTLWSGILLEDGEVRIRPEAVEAIKALDERGILHSIASRNDHDLAMRQIEQHGLRDYFLYPQINWNPKSDSVKQIATSLNLGIDALAFVDDQPFERDEVLFAHPDMMCVDALDLDRLLHAPEFNPPHITEDSRSRRLKYLADIQRTRDESEFTGTSTEFLASLRMVFTISEAEDDDLRRAEDLTVRTHQLNSTGYTYSHDELRAFASSPDHLLLMAELDDRYGSYGKIGLALVDLTGEAWTLKLLLMSCRVMSRGVGTVLLNHVMRLARGQGRRLRAEFLPTDRNRIMYVTYKFAGFQEIGKRDDVVILESDLTALQPVPGHLTLRVRARSS